MKKQILITILINLVSVIVFADCYQGIISVPAGRDDAGNNGSAKLSFKIDFPTKESHGHFTSELLNGDQEFIRIKASGKKLYKISDIITPDDLVMVNPPFGYRCPCIGAVSQDNQVMLAIETDMDGNPIPRFDRYFNVPDPQLNIKFEELKKCE